MDMGPYYIAALVNCLGPIRRVSADARIGSPTRTVTAPERLVDEVPVTVNTHASAVFSFDSGAIGTILMSFDVWDTTLPRIEIYGTEGTLSLNDPNTFDGDVRLRRREHSEWQVLEPVTPLFGAVGTPEQHRRGLGVNDLAGALADSRTGPAPRSPSMSLTPCWRSTSPPPSASRSSLKAGPNVPHPCSSPRPSPGFSPIS